MNNIEIFFEDIEILKMDTKPIQHSVNTLIYNELKGLGNISIIFCSDAYLLQVNQQYLNHNYFTDIITFDYVENNIISGDLFISIDRITENAIKYNTEFAKELYRVIFHGILHLIGYNDKTEDEKKIMRVKENFYLQKTDLSGVVL